MMDSSRLTDNNCEHEELKSTESPLEWKPQHGSQEKAEEPYASLMHAAPDGILMCSQKKSVVDCNEAAAEQFGCAQTALVGASLFELMPELNKVPFAENGRFTIDVPIQAVRKDGTQFPVELHGYTNAENTGCHYALFVHDISSRMKARDRRHQIQQQIDETRRLEAIGSLSAGIAHEINTPIQFIGDNLDYLSEALGHVHQSYKNYHALYQEVLLDPKLSTLVDTITSFNKSINLNSHIKEIYDALNDSRDGIKQVRDIVLLMKQFAHPGSGEKAPTNLNSVVRNVLRICKGRWKHIGEVELVLRQSLPKVDCRVGQIQQVVLNLVLNAIDAVEDKDEAERRIRVETQLNGSWVEVSISDTGSGVPDEVKSRIFDPFFTTKPVGKGTGQGLALAKDFVVKGHGGNLLLVDKDGFATTFLIQLSATNHT